MNLREEFERKVIEPFIDAYGRGITPNPCILCNRYIKFPYLLKIADERGAGYIATGHYARTRNSDELAPVTHHSSLLLKGVDPKKDQSYVLYALGREELERLILPLGEFRKEEVREIARGLGLSSVDRPESQEICFAEEGKYFKLMEGLQGADEGSLIDIASGKVLGRHKGLYRYTLGQRKRLGVATGAPLYVVKIDPTENAVYVGPKEHAMMREFDVEDVNWLIDRNLFPGKFRASVKVRSTMRAEPATVTVLDERRARVVYDEPQWAPAPGQAAVFYEGDSVIGGGVIQ